jgi:outer membrane receptor protein involved in Fe transport
VQSLSRVLSSLGICVLLGGPVSMAPAFAQTVPAVAQNVPNSATVSGTVSDSQGAPINGAKLTFSGPATASATTDANGHYSVNLQPGVYSVTVEHAGFQTATQTDVAVVAGGADVSVSLSAATFSSLQTIGSTRTTANRAGGRTPFNVTPASVQVTTQQVFKDEGQLQMRQILDQTPGIISGLPGTSANTAAPGAITFPDIRGALSFETAALIDGHPLAVQDFGDYVTTFLSPYMFQSVETIKGPGAASPLVDRAIGGTVNFRTLDPTPHQTGNITYGVDSFGGSFSNFNYSNTFFNGKVGVVLDYAINGTPGPAGATDPQWFIPNSGYTYKDSHGDPVTVAGAKTVTPPGQFNAGLNATTTAFGCCVPVPETFDSKNELAKVRVNLSSSTSFTMAYLGSQTYSDQNGNTLALYPTNFIPGPTYTGSLNPGPKVGFAPFGYGDEWEFNNEPIFEGELRTSYKNDNILARWYHASINRLQSNGAVNYTAPSPVWPVKLYGTTSTGAPLNGLDPFGGFYTAQETSGFYFGSSEEDRLTGGSFEYDHFLGGNGGNVITFAADWNHAYSHDYSENLPETSATVPAGSAQDTDTYLLRGQFALGEKLSLVAADYETRFYSYYGHAQYPIATATAPFLAFSSQEAYHNDPRLGLAYRVNPDTSLRFSAGSAVANPYLAILTTATRPAAICTAGGVTGCPTGYSAGSVAVSSLSGESVRPETSFGYDLGGDFRMPKDPSTVVTADIYQTDLFNQFVKGYFNNGAVTIGSTTLPLLTTQYFNLSNARYEGIELGITHTPVQGMGYVLQGALIRGFPYNLPNLTKNGNTGLVGIVPDVNFGSFDTVGNHTIPYSQGYFELNYRSLKSGFASIGITSVGSHNGFAEPGFIIWSATGRIPLVNRATTLQVSVDNAFNTYPGLFSTNFQGVNLPLTTGGYYATQLKEYGPRNIRFSISHDFGTR